MPIINDPDGLSQGGETSVAATTFASASSAQIVITSGNIPSVTAGDYIEVRDALETQNNGLYIVDSTVASTSITATKQALVGSVVNPLNDATSQTVRIFGSDANEKNIYFDTANKAFTFLNGFGSTTVLDNAGVLGQSLYSFMKEEWKNDNDLVKYPFPMVAITPEQFEFDEWIPVDESGSGGESTISTTDASNTRKLIRTAGWSEVNAAGNIQQQYIGAITLGTFEDNTNDLAYYQLGNDPTDTTAPTDFDFAGPVNEAINTYSLFGPITTTGLDFTTSTITRPSGSFITDGFIVGGRVTVINATNSANDITAEITNVTATVITVSGTPFTADTGDTTAEFAVDNRNRLKVFLRVRDGDTNGKTFAQADLPDIGVVTLTNQVYRFPLSNATDLKIAETDANIDSTSPYTEVQIRYFDQAFSRDVDTTSTPRDFGIVIDVGTFSGVDGSTTSAGSTLTAADDGITAADFTGGTLTILEGANAGNYTISGTPTTGAGTVTVTITGTFANTLSNQSFVLQRATPVVATAEEIYEVVQRKLRQSADIDSTLDAVTGRTADELLLFVGDTLVTGRSLPSNPNGGGSGVYISGFDSNDTNRITFTDNSATERTFPFVAAGSISFNNNLVADTGPAEYWMFFTYTERFTQTDFALTSSSGDTATLTSGTVDLSAELADGDYIALSGFADDEGSNGVWQVSGTPLTGSATVIRSDGATAVDEAAGATVNLDKNPIDSPDAIIVNDNDGPSPIAGNIGGSSVGFNFDYDGNVQGGRTAGTNAQITLRAIGLDTAQFVETTGEITRNTGLSFSLVAALERNFLNPV